MADKFFELLNEPAPHARGTRVEMVEEMQNDPDPIPAGTQGTVVGGNGAQLNVDWDNGRHLSLLIGTDKYKVVAD